MSGETVDVLAVDDNPTNLLSLEGVLANLGANLVKAQSGNEALLRILERDFAVVLLDIQMPGLDGFETARLIRSRDRSKHVPIIFLTAFAHDPQQVELGYELGAVDFLFKPISPSVLKSKVGVFLDLHRKTREVMRQAGLLQEASRREHERTLAEARSRWEQERLRAEMEGERKAAEALAQKAAELASNVAERERAEEALRQNNERLQTLSSTANRILIASDPITCVGEVAGELSTRVGLESAAAHLLVQGDTLELAWHAGVPEELFPGPGSEGAGLALIESAATQRRRVVVESLQASDDSRLLRLRQAGIRAAACVPLVADGHLLGTLTFLTARRDTFTEDELAVIQVVADQLAVGLERNQLVQQLRQVASELREADRRKDEFLAMLAHELRNPLAPIVNALGLVARQVNQPSLNRVISAAERQALHMARLVDDLLDVSRITQGKIELRRERTLLQTVISHAVETSSHLIQVRKHQLAVEVPRDPVTIDVDATRLAQVVANLLHNAAKYTDEGGHLRLSCSVEGEQLGIEVQDDGVGLRPEMLEKVFDTFVQVDPTSDRARGGLGLGLTLVRSLVQLHGGTVSAWSDGPGKGARFTVRLPVVRNDGGAVDVPSQSENRIMPRRILLVEDNEDIRLTLRDLLEFEGHEVEEAADGPRGADAIVKLRPNVALVDIGLPGLDGYGVAQRVRAEAPSDPIRLVALTGYGGDDVTRKVREAGFDAHLIKPVKVEELFRVLGDLG